LSLLTAEGIVRSFYGVAALRGADLTVESGTITGLIGPNGAGKTTLFNCVSGLLPIDAGRVVFDGEDITGWRPDRITRRGLVRTFQVSRGFPKLTVLENLLMYGPEQPGERLATALFLRGAVDGRERDLVKRAEAIASMLNLSAVLDHRASDISGGQKKLLELGRAMMTDPKLVLLDEPIAGVNPTLAEEIAARLVELKQAGITFLVVEHNMDVIARLCDPVVVMAEGKKLVEGQFATIAASPQVQEAYMGRRRWAS
jgi:ABC-type branched-subunit amino acid transport system ATPase component